MTVSLTNDTGEASYSAPARTQAAIYTILALVLTVITVTVVYILGKRSALRT